MAKDREHAGTSRQAAAFWTASGSAESVRSAATVNWTPSGRAWLLEAASRMHGLPEASEGELYGPADGLYAPPVPELARRRCGPRVQPFMHDEPESHGRRGQLVQRVFVAAAPEFSLQRGTGVFAAEDQLGCGLGLVVRGAGSRGPGASGAGLPCRLRWR